MHDLGDDFSVSAVFAHWQAPISVFSWVSCGHQPPLLVREDGAVEDLGDAGDVALGVGARERDFGRRWRRLKRGERVVLHSDGVFDRPTAAGRSFGLAGIQAAVAAAGGASASATARSIQHAVVRASAAPLEDDVAVLVLAVG